MSKLPEDRREMFTDAYRYYESHWDMPCTVDAWEKAAKDMCEVARKHDNNGLIARLLLAVYDTISEEHRRMMEQI